MSVEVKEVKSSEEVALAKLLTSIEHLVTQATDTLVERVLLQGRRASPACTRHLLAAACGTLDVSRGQELTCRQTRRRASWS